MTQAYLFDPGATERETDKDSWCTPPEIMEAVHRFWPGGIGVDPCSNGWARALDFVRAKVSYTKDDDLLVQPPFVGTCWWQPPYGPVGGVLIGAQLPQSGKPHPGSWAARWDRGEMTETLALVKLDTSTKHWDALSSRSTSLVLFRKRIQHYIAGERNDKSNICSAMFMFTRHDPRPRRRALAAAVGDLGRVYR